MYSPQCKFVFVGDAELTDIPEGYTPQHWEYQRVICNLYISPVYVHFKLEFFQRHFLKVGVPANDKFP